MPVKKSEATHDCKAECADLYKQLAALKKEVAALKAELKKAPKGGGGADPRVDKLINILKDHKGNWLANKYLESLGIKFNN